MTPHPYRAPAVFTPTPRPPWWRRALCAIGAHRWRYLVRGERASCTRVGCDHCPAMAMPYQVLPLMHDRARTGFHRAPRCPCARCDLARRIAALGDD